jgi:nicotinamide-nucleotide adenylyltransferase
MIEIGVIHGRFQVLHNDHMKYLLAGKDRCNHLVVGITNPDTKLTRSDPAAPDRSDPLSNPLTYFERQGLVHDAMCESEIDSENFTIVPFPINFPELYDHYVPMDATFFLTIYDNWGRRKLEMFQELGLKTEVLWERSLEKKGLSAGDIRLLMAQDQPWEHLVPPSNIPLLKRWDIPKRLRKLYSSKQGGITPEKS